MLVDRKCFGVFVIKSHFSTYTKDWIMADQKKLTSFFSPLAAANKRRINSKETPPPKKMCKDDEIASEENVDPVNQNTLDSSSPLKPKDCLIPLSPEQKLKVDDNKTQAELKLLSKKTNGLVVNIGVTWYKALKLEFSKPYFKKLTDFISSERTSAKIFPPAEQVFSWTNHFPIKEVKCVILGQDPYHNVGQAHGLCFSVQQGIQPPPSLENMYKTLEKDCPGFKHPGHGNLSGWADQGVLLLNACLTVRAHQANSHQGKGWEQFTDATIKWINDNTHGVVFMLWGSYAQKKGACIDKKRHHILKSVHPSPLSAYRGFFDCQHFSKCNELLRKQGKCEIDWRKLPKC